MYFTHGAEILGEIFFWGGGGGGCNVKCDYKCMSKIFSRALMLCSHNFMYTGYLCNTIVLYFGFYLENSCFYTVCMWGWGGGRGGGLPPPVPSGLKMGGGGGGGGGVSTPLPNQGGRALRPSPYFSPPVTTLNIPFQQLIS